MSSGPQTLTPASARWLTYRILNHVVWRPLSYIPALHPHSTAPGGGKGAERGLLLTLLSFHQRRKIFLEKASRLRNILQCVPRFIPAPLMGTEGGNAPEWLKPIRDFLGGPMVETSPSSARGAGVIPGLENQDPTHCIMAKKIKVN